MTPQEARAKVEEALTIYANNIAAEVDRLHAEPDEDYRIVGYPSSQPSDPRTALLSAVDALVAAEREACAVAVEVACPNTVKNALTCIECRGAAKAIRRRG